MKVYGMIITDEQHQAVHDFITGQTKSFWKLELERFLVARGIPLTLTTSKGDRFPAARAADAFLKRAKEKDLISIDPFNQRKWIPRQCLNELLNH